MESMPYRQGRDSDSQRTELSDGILLEQSLAGDEYAFEVLVSRYHNPLLNYIRRVLNDDELAYDVLQFVLLQLYISLPKLLTNMPLQSWLFRVARNRCFDELRKQRRRPAISFSELPLEYEGKEISQIDSIEDPRLLPEEIVELHDLHNVLQRAIYDLPPRFRWIVHLHSFGQLPFSEIGRILKIPETTAKTYYYRALPHLRSALVSSS